MCTTPRLRECERARALVLQRWRVLLAGVEHGRDLRPSYSSRVPSKSTARSGAMKYKIRRMSSEAIADPEKREAGIRQRDVPVVETDHARPQH